MQTRTHRKKLLHFGTLALAFSAVMSAMLFTGCAAAGTSKATVATINQDTTTAIAAAGTATSTAAAAYNAGKIAKTPANLAKINLLGGAYNEARVAYLVYLNANSAYLNLLNQQGVSCAPPPAVPPPAEPGTASASAPQPGPASTTGPNSPACNQATQSALAGQIQLSAMQAALNGKMASMQGAQSSVQALK